MSSWSGCRFPILSRQSFKIMEKCIASGRRRELSARNEAWEDQRIFDDADEQVCMPCGEFAALSWSQNGTTDRDWSHQLLG